MPHTSRLIASDVVAQPRGHTGTQNPWDKRLIELCEDGKWTLTAAISAIAGRLAQLQPGTLVAELGARCGDLALDLARRFPELVFQPVEGLGQTSPSLHLLLHERIAGHNAQHEQTGAPSLLLPKSLSTSAPERWLLELGRLVGVLLAVNSAQYIGWEGLVGVVRGARRVLSVGGLLLLVGPCLGDGGPPPEGQLLYDEALKRFAVEASTRRPGQPPLQWRIPCLRHLRQAAQQEGLDFVGEEKIVGVDGWLVVTFRQGTAPPRLRAALVAAPARAPSKGQR